METKRESVRVKILHEHEKNPGTSYSQIAKLCRTSKSNVCKTIQRFKNGYSIKSKPKTGRPKGPANKQLEARVLKTLRANRSMSVRDVAKKHGTTKDFVQRTKKRNNLKSFKKQKVPKRTKKQANTAIKRSRILYKHLVEQENVCIVMDDETYVKMDFSTLPGSQYYIAEPGEVLEDREALIAVEKFGEKILVWQAICQCGQKSAPFFVRVQLTLKYM